MCRYPAGHALLEQQLPDFPGPPTVVLTQAQLQRFRAIYGLLLQFAADVTDTTMERVNLLDLEKWRREHGVPVRDALVRSWFEDAGLELPFP